MLRKNDPVLHPPKNLFCPGLGSYYDQLCSPSVKHDVIMDDVQSVVKEKTEPIASMLEQSNAILNKSPGDDGRIQVGLQSLEQGAEEELICLRPEAESGMENTCAEYIQHVDRNDSLEPLIKMTRPNVRFREYVVKLHDDREECILCGHIFAKRTSTTRIRHHLSGETGKGVEPCVGNVPEEIKEAALGRNGSSSTPPGEDLASGLADQRFVSVNDTLSFSPS